MWLCFDQAFLIADGPADGSVQLSETVSTVLFTESDDSVVIHLFATRADCRLQGHGSRLLKLLEDYAHAHAKDVLVEAKPRTGNQAPPEFWVKCNYNYLITVGPSGGPSGRWYPASGVYGKAGMSLGQPVPLVSLDNPDTG